MILTDREIKISLERRLIEISPPPSDMAFSSTSVDLTLDKSISLFKKKPGGLNQSIDPSHAEYRFDNVIKELTETKEIDPVSGLALSRNELVLGWTHETINLKSEARVAARVEGKSSLARLGLAIHVTAPTIHAGFKGRIQLEIINHGHLPIVLRPGMRICQLILEQSLGVPDRGYSGQFANQRAE